MSIQPSCCEQIYDLGGNRTEGERGLPTWGGGGVEKEGKRVPKAVQSLQRFPCRFAREQKERMRAALKEAAPLPEIWMPATPPGGGGGGGGQTCEGLQIFQCRG